MQTEPLDHERPFDAESAEAERYELRESPPYRFEANRREFVQVLGAGLVIAVSSRVAHAQRGGRGGGQGAAARPERISQRFHIAEDGTVTVMSGKVEAGQGSRTQIIQAAAEELRIPVDRIRAILADTQLCPDDGGTAGSRTTPATVPRVRAAAAAARELLKQMAATRLGVDRAALEQEGGVFVDRTSRRQVTLAELASSTDFRPALDVDGPQGVELTRVDQWKVLGTPVAKVNGQEVVTGTAEFPSDIARPGMLYGKVLRPPSLAATLRSIDMEAARADGVTLVRDSNFVGCAARSSFRATQAIEALATKAQWDSPPQLSSDRLFAHLKNSADPGARANEWGDRAAALASAKKKFQAAYTVAYIQHAPMEPRAAVAEWTNGQLTVWTGTQQPARVRGQLAEAFRLRQDQVRVIVPDTGGGFGGKHTGEVAIEAARLAKAAGQPVCVRWTREEEFTWAYFRPAGLIEVEAGLDQNANLVVWDFSNYNSGGSAIDTPYQVPHGRTRFLASQAPLRQGSYRALASTANTFARESAMDELALAASTDPLEFRLSHLPDGRLKDVLRSAAERFEWRSRWRATRAPQHGLGLACGTEKGSYVAACAEVEVRDGRIKVLSVCQSYECGAIQNPVNLRAQVEGCIVMGLGGALTEEIRFQDGVITNGSFAQYQVPRMHDVPPLDITLLDRRDLPSVGAGETPIIAVAPAIANAVYHASGTRLRALPLKLQA